MDREAAPTSTLENRFGADPMSARDGSPAREGEECRGSASPIKVPAPRTPRPNP